MVKIESEQVRHATADVGMYAGMAVGIGLDGTVAAAAVVDETVGEPWAGDEGDTAFSVGIEPEAGVGADGCTQGRMGNQSWLQHTLIGA